MEVTEQRRARRFEISLPVEVTRGGSARALQLGQTKNISSGGVLFTVDSPLDIGGVIEYRVTLTNTGQEPVFIRCMGKVVRVGNDPGPDVTPKRISVAATLERYEFIRKR